MSNDWAWGKTQAANKAMKAVSYMGYHESCDEIEKASLLSIVKMLTETL